MFYFSVAWRRIAAWLVVVLSLLGVAGCRSLAYYAHVGHGQMRLLWDRRPVAAVIADPTSSPMLKARLRLAGQARRYASAHLGLPDNRSYTSYVQLDRPYVVWNVFAAPAYSITPIRHCFPVAGCVAYRGYFNYRLALAEAARERAAGNDVYIGPVAAYSTLGWFADPILSSMLRWDDDELDGTIFHELAHQLIYVRDDSSFNESFASFVQQQGLREWRRSRGLPPGQDDEQAEQRFTALVLDLRARLGRLYAQPLAAEAKAAGKQAEIAAFRQRYRIWRESEGPADHRYDAWVAAPIDNARLVPFGLYDQWTPAFAVLFQRAGRDWKGFYAQVRRLAAEPREQRTAELQRLLEPSQRVVAPSPRALPQQPLGGTSLYRRTGLECSPRIARLAFATHDKPPD